jgi:hypothetical protein
MKQVIGLLALACALWFIAMMIRPVPTTAHTVKHPNTWDGIEGHPDCTDNGHPSPTESGVTISDQYTDACR